MKAVLCGPDLSCASHAPATVCSPTSLASTVQTHLHHAIDNSNALSTSQVSDNGRWRIAYKDFENGVVVLIHLLFVLPCTRRDKDPISLRYHSNKIKPALPPQDSSLSQQSILTLRSYKNKTHDKTPRPPSPPPPPTTPASPDSDPDSTPPSSPPTSPTPYSYHHHRHPLPISRQGFL